MWRIVHDENNTGDNLHQKHEGEDAAKCEPVVEVLWRGEIEHRFLHHCINRQALMEPLSKSTLGCVSRLSTHDDRVLLNRYGFWYR